MQMQKNSNLNRCVDTSYDILKYILRNNKDYEKDIGMALVSLTAFLIYYGIKDIDTIISAYKNTKYTVTEENLKLLSGKKTSSDIECMGISIPNITLFGTSTNFKVYIDDELKLKKLKKRSHTEYLETFIHEMNHIIKSQNKRILYVDHNKLIIRSGIIILDNDIKKLVLKSKTHEFTEEGLNTLQTKDILGIVARLCNEDIKNKHAKKYLDKIRKEITTYDIKSYYNPAMSILEPLYVEQKFRNQYINGSITGNINDISDDFDYYVHDGSFEELTSSIDEYYNNGFQNSPMKKAVELVIGYQYSKRK